MYKFTFVIGVQLFKIAISSGEFFIKMKPFSHL